MPTCAADSWRYRSCKAACTVLAFRSPRRTSASMRVRRAATSANSAATKNAFASTSATNASRRTPSDSRADSGMGIEAGTYPVLTRLQAPPYEALAAHLPQLGAADPETAAAVRAILEDVRARGDEAVREHARRLDKVDLEPGEWEVTGVRCQEALARIPAPLRAALEVAVARVRAYHAKQVEHGFLERDVQGAALGMRVVPLDRVGVYVPGGKAAYPSTVIMNVVPAVVAGVREIVMVTPPGGPGRTGGKGGKGGKEGTPDVVLAAAGLAGVTRLFRVGGAQAIAALAYGTRTVPRVDKIVGPGNRFVTEAKRQVGGAGVVGIDMLARSRARRGGRSSNGPWRITAWSWSSPTWTPPWKWRTGGRPSTSRFWCGTPGPWPTGSGTPARSSWGRGPPSRWATISRGRHTCCPPPEPPDMFRRWGCTTS